LMGQITHRLLETMDIPWLPFPKSEADIAPTMEKAEASMAKRSKPFALVMSEGTIAEHELRGQKSPESVPCDLRRWPAVAPGERLIRTEALQILLESLGGTEAILGTTGKTGRELFTIADRPNHLYVVGGMGTASAIGFGVAQALPKQPVVVIDGDGAALMKLGSFATIGYYQPGNLLHVLLDNESHDSTGGQRTASGIVDFAAVAAATNYRNAFAAERAEDIREALKLAQTRSGPTLLHLRIRAGSPQNLGRPTVKPHEVKERFMAFLRSQQAMA
jgi:phosphonopyruvate decarboxylase